MKKILILLVMFIGTIGIQAQINMNGLDDGSFTANDYQNNRKLGVSDSVQSQHKEIPRGIKAWTIDEHFGDKKPAVPDTLSYMYMNTIFTTGLRGEYNSLGNLGSPRQNRIFLDRTATSEFFFLDPYDQFVVQPSNFKFTSTLSPITILSYNTAGNRLHGEDHFKAFFAVNAGKKWGFGFIFDYIYGRGYYSNQNTSHFNYSMWGSYIGERYNASLLLSLNHQKVAENGGITNDAYITHPEIFKDNFSTDEIPTVLAQNWNRNDNQHVFFNHRYSLGFFRKVPMTKEEIEARKFAIKSEQAQAEQKAKDKARRKAKANGNDFDEEEYDKQHKSSGRPDDASIAGDAPTQVKNASVGDDRIKVNMQDSTQLAQLNKQPLERKDTTEQWLKSEYVPVTSFIHTARFDNYTRIYQAYKSPENYYINDYYNYGTTANDSIYDQTKHWSLKNTFAVALLEGFNKWAKAGLKVFASHELRHYEFPTYATTNNLSVFGGYEKINQSDISIGGQLLKESGKTLHYNVSAETWLVGKSAGQFHIDGYADLNVPLLGDTAQLAVNAFIHNDRPSMYFTRYVSKHFVWDNDLSKQFHSRIMAELSLKKTESKLRFGYDLIKNYIYLGLQNDRIGNGDGYLVQNNQVNVRQTSGAINLITLQLLQNLHWSIFHWDNVLTFQKSSDEKVLPTPIFNVYSNFYLRFKIARVLKCDLGADMRWFTKYYAPEYIPALGSFGIQGTDASRTKIGGYPVINAYANFTLQHTRFFVMFSHVNAGNSGDYFFTPHYPLNQRIFRFGLSWNFFN